MALLLLQDFVLKISIIITKDTTDGEFYHSVSNWLTFNSHSITVIFYLVLDIEKKKAIPNRLYRWIETTSINSNINVVLGSFTAAKRKLALELKSNDSDFILCTSSTYSPACIGYEYLFVTAFKNLDTCYSEERKSAFSCIGPKPHLNFSTFNYEKELIFTEYSAAEYNSKNPEHNSILINKSFLPFVRKTI